MEDDFIAYTQNKKLPWTGVKHKHFFEKNTQNVFEQKHLKCVLCL